jgi:hypothetical protein
MRRLLFSLVVATWLAVGTPAAWADPPGPTDYQSEITAIDPAVTGISLRIVGGDSFVVLDVAPEHEVDVVGYFGEPYLRFGANGSVAVNTRSPSRYLNEDRFGATAVPGDADAAAAPLWDAVASSGSYAWHDHRTHWMNPMSPPGLGPGDQVAEGVIPLVVDGVAVDVTVKSFWMPVPSRLPVFVGFAAGFLILLLVVRRNRISLGLVALSLAVLVVGLIAFWSMPAETAPAWSLWALPATSLIAAVAAAASGRGEDRTGRLGRYRPVLQLTAALELVGWSILHRQWLWRAIIPTQAPFWVDRLVAATAMVAAAGIAVSILYGVARAPSRAPRP